MPSVESWYRMRLFTYTIPIDDGAAPNPFGGMCSLAICKPGIRRVAKEGDWIAGLGSKKAPSGDLSGHLVYAMRVDESMTLQEYDLRAAVEWPTRVPDFTSPDPSARLGDCIYDYSHANPRQRPGVHGPSNRATDISGENALISRHFYYFGNRAIQLPDFLLPICHQTQGHRSDSNAAYFDQFVSWLQGLGLLPGQLYGAPDTLITWTERASSGGCLARKLDGECDSDTDGEQAIMDSTGPIDATGAYACASTTQLDS